MYDQSWLLKAGAIKAAKVCIRLIKHELGITMRLSNTTFLIELKEYTELADSDALNNAFHELLSYAHTDSTLQHPKSA